jgi:ribosomal protein L40E
VTCPHCGASNAPSATWCTQCYASLQEPPAADPGPGPAPTTPSPAAAPGEPPLRDPAPDSGLRRGEDGLEWSCVACETVNPIEVSSCTACGVAFAARFAVAEHSAPVDWASARTASLFLPGLGHLRAGRPAGWARLLLFGVWAVGGILVLIGAGASGLLVAGPLLLGAVVVHVATQLDLRALERDGRELLDGRALLWLVVGVTVLVIVGAVVGLGSAVGTSAPSAGAVLDS